MIVRIATPKDHKKMLAFQHNLYNNNPNYRDAQSRTLKALLSGKLQIQKTSQLTPIVAEKQGKILGISVLAIIDRMPEYLQLSFLEFEKDPAVLKALIEFATQEAKSKGIGKLLLGLNLHVNYGLGFLASDFDKVQSLGSAYNPSYYVEYIRPLASRVRDLVSYKGKISQLDISLPPKVMERISRRFEIRPGNFWDLQTTAKIYNDINNKAFKNHDYYYQRREKEDLELFKEYRLFLKPENLLFAYYQGKPVGFMLWYPDFNQLIAPGKELGPMAVLKSRLFPKLVNSMKITEVGVLPMYQRSGAIYALLNHCYQLNKNRYDYVESGWILAENFMSKSLGAKFIQKESKRYQVFEIDV